MRSKINELKKKGATELELKRVKYGTVMRYVEMHPKGKLRKNPVLKMRDLPRQLGVKFNMLRVDSWSLVKRDKDRDGDGERPCCSECSLGAPANRNHIMWECTADTAERARLMLMPSTKKESKKFDALVEKGHGEAFKSQVLSREPQKVVAFIAMKWFDAGEHEAAA